MENFGNMTYEELLHTQAQIKNALMDFRRKAIKEKIDKIVNDIDELNSLIEKLGGDSTISCIRTSYLPDIDLYEYKSLLSDDCFYPSMLFNLKDE